MSRNQFHTFQLLMLHKKDTDCMLSSGLFTGMVSRYEVYVIPTHLWRWNRQSVPKCWHLNYRRQLITQKKAYDIQNMAKVWNQGRRCLPRNKNMAVM
jgi:hypothetical protein